MKGVGLLFAFLIFHISALFAQSIEISPAQKIIAKYDDYEILGTNDIGTVIHYFSKGNHKLQIFNSKMRPFNEVELDFEEKKSIIEKVILTNDLILIFYTTTDDNYEHLKVKRINYRLDVTKEGIVLDSVKINALNSLQGYFVKPSLNENHFVAFTYEEKGNRMQVHYLLMDKALKVVKTGDVWTEDKENKTLESVKVDNEGDILITIGHLNKKTSDQEDYSFTKFTSHYIAIDSQEALTSSIGEDDILYKDLVTNWDEEKKSAVLVGTYKKTKSQDEMGVFYTSIKENNQEIQYVKVPFVEEDFIGSNSPYKKWHDNAEIQIPKRIIPRSDGGFIYLLEAEYHEYQLISTAPTSSGYPYNPEYGNYYDENYFYDIIAVSVNPNGEIDWKINMPKSQETENDLGRYSSFLYVSSNNISKLLFVDDIYGNGNLTEFNFNPNGEWNKQVLLNSYRDDLQIVIKKGKQTTGNEVIIPSEKKNKLRLIKITF